MNLAAVIGLGLLAVVLIIAVIIGLAAIPARERDLREARRGTRDPRSEHAERASMERLRSGAAAERVASPAFRSAFGAPWEEAPPPERVQETFVPDFLQPARELSPAEVDELKARFLAAQGQPTIVLPPEPEVEPLPPGELAPWVKEALGGHDGPDAALESIVARVVKSDA